MIKNNLTGSDFRQLRLTMGVTQRKFASDLGISPPYLSDIERDIKKPSQHLINLILSNTTGQRTDIHLRDVAAEQQFMCGWTPEVREACRAVKKILEAGDKTTADALRMNIAAFEKSIDSQEQNARLREDVEQLKRDIDEIKRIQEINRRTGTD